MSTLPQVRPSTQVLPLPGEYEALRQVSHAFFKSGLFEDLTDASQAFVKILRGKELGLPPVASMHAFDVIQKRLFIRGQTCAALINACPYAGFTPLSTTNAACTIRFHRRGKTGQWADLPDVTYTIEEATKRGLVQRSPEWKTSPGNMLYWRCMTRGASHYFPELLAGLTTVDEAPGPLSDTQARATIAELYGERPSQTLHNAPGAVFSQEPESDPEEEDEEPGEAPEAPEEEEDVEDLPPTITSDISNAEIRISKSSPEPWRVQLHALLPELPPNLQKSFGAVVEDPAMSCMAGEEVLTRAQAYLAVQAENEGQDILL